MEFLRCAILIIITMIIAPLAQIRAHESIREKCFKLYKVFRISVQGISKRITSDTRIDIADAIRSSARIRYWNI